LKYRQFGSIGFRVCTIHTHTQTNCSSYRAMTMYDTPSGNDQSSSTIKTYTKPISTSTTRTTITTDGNHRTRLLQYEGAKRQNDTTLTVNDNNGRGSYDTIDHERVPLQSNYYDYYHDKNNKTNNNNNNNRINHKSRNSSNSTIVTSNRSGDSLKNRLYNTFDDQPNVYDARTEGNTSREQNKRSNSGGYIAIISSTISILLCCIVLVTFIFGFVSIYFNNSSKTATTAAKSFWNLPFSVNNYDESSNNNTTTNTSSTTYTRQHILDQQIVYAQQYYDNSGRYIIEDYDIQPILTNFLPGLVGIYGIPMYTFYINRGQAITSFGYKSKDYPIQEFHSANIAEQITSYTGFRTFIQMKSLPSSATKRGIQTKLIEPFSVLRSRFPTEECSKPDNDETCLNTDNNIDIVLEDLPKRFMYVGTNDIQIQEIDTRNRIETNVTFFLLPEEDFAAFAKRTTITYLQQQHIPYKITRTINDPSDTIEISMIDGLTNIVPAGGKMNDFLKNMGRTLEGWMRVDSPYNDNNNNNRIEMPFYRLSTIPTDTETVTVQNTGHWCISIRDEDFDTDSPPKLLPIIYDLSRLFGNDTSLLRPIRLQSRTISSIVNKEHQYGNGKTPSAFGALTDVTLHVGQSLTMTTFFGKADHILDVPVIARRLLQPGFAQFKMTRASELAKQITSTVDSRTSNPLLDGHVQQMFLDNTLRGGIAQILGEDNDDSKLRCTDEDERLKVYHLFSRIHGDLERDYNLFEIEPTFFSSVCYRC
jgi:hypothetical protein